MAQSAGELAIAPAKPASLLAVLAIAAHAAALGHVLVTANQRKSARTKDLRRELRLRYGSSHASGRWR